jgi:hypothetical protein
MARESKEQRKADQTWAYATPEREEAQNIVDFMAFAYDNACPSCGAPAYIQAAPGGVMRVRWRCGHSAWSGEEQDDSDA